MLDAVRRPLEHLLPRGRSFFTRELHVDIESRSKFNLKKVSLSAYSRHKSTQIILAAWSFGAKGPIKQWKLGEPLPQELIEALLDPRCLKIAHNSEFERVMFEHHWFLRTPINEWLCTMTWARMISLPGGLERLGPILKIPLEFLKFSEGNRLIRIFCVPNKLTKKRTKIWRDIESDPVDWEKFCEYNRQDVEAERYIMYQRLLRYDIKDDEWGAFFRLQQTNENGWPIDRDFVRNCIRIGKMETDSIMDYLREVTGVANPNADPQLGPWIRERGYPFGDMRAGTIKRALAMPELAEIHEVLQLRSELKRTSVKKYPKILESLPDNEDLMRYCYSFAGASRTGRAAAKGAQPQNFTRPPKWMKDFMADIVESIRKMDLEWLRMMYGPLLPILAGAVRSAAHAQRDHQFVIADLSSIETCMTAWIANCQPLLDVFAKGIDPYIEFATRFYRVRYEDVTPDQRQQVKPVVLGCCFGLGAGSEQLSRKTGDMEKTGLWGYAEKNGVTMSQEEAAEAVEVYRDGYAEVPQTWYDIERAAKKCIRTHEHTHVTRDDSSVLPSIKVPMSFEMNGPFLLFHIPNGDTLYYLRPMIEKVKTPWGEWKWTITYEGKEDDDEGHSFWGRTPTRGAKLFQNAVQATANRQLRVGVAAAYEYGFSVRGESHDELITHERKDSKRYTVEALIDCVTKRAAWGKGLPLKAAGFTTDWYTKD